MGEGYGEWEREGDGKGDRDTGRLGLGKKYDGAEKDTNVGKVVPGEEVVLAEFLDNTHIASRSESALFSRP